MIKRLEELIKETFDNEDVVITLDTNAADIEEWDSLSHVYLIVAIEKEFDIKFNSSEIQKFKNVGEILECIESKL